MAPVSLVPPAADAHAKAVASKNVPASASAEPAGIAGSAAKTEPIAEAEPTASAERAAVPESSATTGRAAHSESPAATAAIAKAAPAAIETSAPSQRPQALAPVVRVAPEFPGEAIRRRIDAGRVRARVTVDAAGHVTGVAIVAASPRGVFDDSVTAALAKWRFPPGSTGRSAVVEVDFHRD